MLYGLDLIVDVVECSQLWLGKAIGLWERYCVPAVSREKKARKRSASAPG
jgi:hypothetical protein